jgi:hypothetical protein
VVIAIIGLVVCCCRPQAPASRSADPRANHLKQIGLASTNFENGTRCAAALADNRPTWVA